MATVLRCACGKELRYCVRHEGGCVEGGKSRPFAFRTTLRIRVIIGRKVHTMFSSSIVPPPFYCDANKPRSHKVITITQM
jgi:hypothetical protein